MAWGLLKGTENKVRHWCVLIIYVLHYTVLHAHTQTVDWGGLPDPRWISRTTCNINRLTVIFTLWMVVFLTDCHNDHGISQPTADRKNTLIPHVYKAFFVYIIVYNEQLRMPIQDNKRKCPPPGVSISLYICPYIHLLHKVAITYFS